MIAPFIMLFINLAWGISLEKSVGMGGWCACGTDPQQGEGIHFTLGRDAACSPPLAPTTSLPLPLC